MKRTKKQRRIDSNSAKKEWEIRRKHKTDKVGTQGVKKSWITRRKNGNDRISEETKNKIRNALIFGQKSVSGSPTGSPSMLADMLEFAARHHIAPQVEHFPMSQVNEALAHLAAGKAHYRVVLDADF